MTPRASGTPGQLGGQLRGAGCPLRGPSTRPAGECMSPGMGQSDRALSHLRPGVGGQRQSRRGGGGQDGGHVFLDGKQPSNNLISLRYSEGSVGGKK